MKIQRTSQLTLITRTLDLDVTIEQIEAWHNGAVAQEAFPNLSPADREFIMTGITASEWESIFSEEIEETA